jgi:putative Mg2+ transporter-C (MgtC) family protein
LLESILIRTSIPEWEIALRLLVAVILGGIIGWEREVNNRPAGLRTHMLTSLAAAGFAIMAMELAAIGGRNASSADPIRAIEAVTAGVAFLAAGTIIQSRGKVSGLTTGAGMWLAGGLGVAAGFGFYFVAATMGAIAFFVLVVLQRLSDRLSTNLKKS